MSTMIQDEFIELVKEKFPGLNVIPTSIQD